MYEDMDREMEPITIDFIKLGPNANFQGGIRYFSLIPRNTMQSEKFPLVPFYALITRARSKSIQKV